MKKLITIICFVFACHISMHAQNPVPNPGFESWTNYGPYEDPDDWGTKNEGTFPIGAFSVKQDNDSHTGNYAAKLITIGHGNDIFPGEICTGEVLFDSSACKGGFPVSHGFEKFNGWFKYAPAIVDTFGTMDACRMFAMLTKWNTATGSRDTIALAMLVLGDSVPEYSQFSKDFAYFLQDVPDSGQVIIISTNNISHPTVGSILVVDDIEFNGIVGVDEITYLPVKVYPNPADEMLQLQIPAAMHAGNVQVFDYLGRKISSIQVSGSQEMISTKQFPDGIFFYKIHNDEGKLLTSGKFVVKH